MVGYSTAKCGELNWTYKSQWIHYSIWTNGEICHEINIIKLLILGSSMLFIYVCFTDILFKLSIVLGKLHMYSDKRN